MSGGRGPYRTRPGGQRQPRHGIAERARGARQSGGIPADAIRPVIPFEIDQDFGRFRDRCEKRNQKDGMTHGVDPDRPAHDQALGQGVMVAECGAQSDGAERTAGWGTPLARSDGRAEVGPVPTLRLLLMDMQMFRSVETVLDQPSGREPGLLGQSPAHSCAARGLHAERRHLVARQGRFSGAIDVRGRVPACLIMRLDAHRGPS